MSKESLREKAAFRLLTTSSNGTVELFSCNEDILCWLSAGWLMLVVITVFVLFVCLSRFFTYSFADESEIWIRCNPFESLDVRRLQLFLQIFILSGNSIFFLCFTLTFMDLCREMLCVLHLRSLLRCCFNFSIMFDDLFKCYVILFEFRFGIVYFFALSSFVNHYKTTFTLHLDGGVYLRDVSVRSSFFFSRSISCAVDKCRAHSKWAKQIA